MTVEGDLDAALARGIRICGFVPSDAESCKLHRGLEYRSVPGDRRNSSLVPLIPRVPPPRRGTARARETDAARHENAFLNLAGPWNPALRPAGTSRP